MILSRFTVLKKFNPSEPLLQALTYQLLQRWFGSGTPKGKVMPTKSTRFKVKKKAPDKSQSIRAEEAEKVSLEFMFGPSLTRWIKPRLRKREAGRVSFGLLSIEQKLDLEVQEKKKAGKFPEDPIRLGTPGFDFVTLGLVDEEKIPKYELTVKDGTRLCKASNKIMCKQTRDRQFSDNWRRTLKKAAIKALPKHLRGPAKEPDTSVFPGERILPTLTPPIEGYRERLAAGAGTIAKKKR